MRRYLLHVEMSPMSVVYIINKSVDLLSTYYRQFRSTFVYFVSDCKTLLVLQFTFHPSWYLQAATPLRYFHLSHTHTCVCLSVLASRIVLYSYIALVLSTSTYLVCLLIKLFIRPGIYKLLHHSGLQLYYFLPLLLALVR